MANLTTEIVPIIKEPQELIDNQISTENSKVEVVTALSMLDNIYKGNINNYANQLHEFTYKIEQINAQLKPLYEALKPHQKSLEIIEKDIDYALRTLENLTEKWCQKYMIINELDSELSNLKHNLRERKKILQHRNKDIEDIDSEIEDIELPLLQNELEKQNILMLIEPINEKILEFKNSIKKIEAQKHYIESSQLHNLSSKHNQEQEIDETLPQ